MRPSTSGSRDVIASTLSRLTWAVPVSSDVTAAGAGHRVQAVELGLRRVGEQRRGAVDGEKGAAVRPGRWAPTAVRRSAVDERAGRRGHRRDVGHPRQVGGVSLDVAGADAVGVGMTTVTAVSELLAKSLRNWSPTWCAEAELRQHAVVGETPLDTEERRAEQQQQRDDRPAPSGTARRMTNFVERYQNCLLDGRRAGSGRPSMRRARRRTSSESRRSPSSTRAAGVTTIAATAANATVATPA